MCSSYKSTRIKIFCETYTMIQRVAVTEGPLRACSHILRVATTQAP